MNTYYNVFAYQQGYAKRLIIANDKGINTSSDFKFGTLPTEFCPKDSVNKWVNIRGNTTALLAIGTNGDVVLNHVSSNISSGTWINVDVMYL